MEEKYAKIKNLIAHIKDNDSLAINYFNITENDQDIHKLFFDYLCDTNYLLAAQVLSHYQGENKEFFEQKLYTKLTSFPLSKEVVLSLLYLEKIEYFADYLQKTETEDKTFLTYADEIYNFFVDKGEHQYILYYIYLMYHFFTIMPTLVERLKESPIKNPSCEQYIQKIMLEIKEKETLYEVVDFARNTQSIKNIPQYIHISTKKLLKHFKNAKEKVDYLFDIFMIEQENRVKGLYNWITFLQAKKEFPYYTISKIRALIEIIITTKQNQLIKIESINFQKEQENDLKYQKLIYLWLKSYTDLFSELCDNPSLLIDVLQKTEKNNPFNIERYNYIENSYFEEFLKNNEKYLKERANIYKRNNQLNYDEKIFCYFNSVYRYVVSSKEFFTDLNKKKIIHINNTKILGVLDYNYQTQQWYLDKNKEKIKITFLDYENPLNSNASPVFPSMEIICDLVSYNHDENSFRIRHAKNAYEKESLKYLKILRSVNKDTTYYINWSTIDKKDLFLFSIIKSFFQFSCLYAINKDQFVLQEEDIKLQLRFRIQHFSESELVKTFYSYLLGEKEEIIITNFCNYIKKNLENYQYTKKDLLLEKNFKRFIIEITTILKTLNKCDVSLREKIINELSQQHLKSIVYLVDTSQNEEYFPFIKENKLIFDYYDCCLYNRYKLYDLALQETIPKEILNYLTIKRLLKEEELNIKELEQAVLSIEEDSPFLSWIFAIKRKSDKNSNILNILMNNQKNENEDQLQERLIKLQEKYSKKEEVPETSILQNIMNQYFNKVTQQELSKEQKLELIKPLKSLINNDSYSLTLIYQVLKKLGQNNPFYYDNNLEKEYYSNDHFEEGTKLMSRIQSSKLSIDEKIYLFFNTYLSSSIPFVFIKTFFTQENENKDLKEALSKYKIEGFLKSQKNYMLKIQIDKLWILSKNIRFKIDFIYNNPYVVIPYIDIVPMIIEEITDKDIVKLQVKPNFTEEENWLQEIKKDKNIYQNLDIETKKRILLHICRYDVYQAYCFDKEKIYDKAFYNRIAYEVFTYKPTRIKSLYYFLKTNEKEILRDFIKNIRLDIKIKVLVKLQEKLYSTQEFDLYDELLKEMFSLHYFHPIYIYDKALPILKTRATYNDLISSSDLDNIINKKLETSYAEMKNYEIECLEVAYNHFGKIKYLERYQDVLLDNKGFFFYLKVIYSIILEEQQITDEIYKYLKIADSYTISYNSEDIKDFKNYIKQHKKEIIKLINKYNEQLKENPNDKYKLYLFQKNLYFEDELDINNSDATLDKSMLSYQEQLQKELINKIISLKEKTTNKKINIYSPELFNFAKYIYTIEKNIIINQDSILLKKLIKILDKYNILIPQLIFFKEIEVSLPEAYLEKYNQIKFAQKKSEEVSNLGKLIIDSTSNSKKEYDVITLKTLLSSPTSLLEELMKEQDTQYSIVLITLRILIENKMAIISDLSQEVLSNEFTIKDETKYNIFEQWYYEVIQTAFINKQFKNLQNFLNLTSSYNPFANNSTIKKYTLTNLKDLENSPEINVNEKINIFLNTPVKYNYDFLNYLQILMESDQNIEDYKIPGEFKAVVTDDSRMICLINFSVEQENLQSLRYQKIIFNIERLYLKEKNIYCTIKVIKSTFISLTELEKVKKQNRV